MIIFIKFQVYFNRLELDFIEGISGVVVSLDMVSMPRVKESVFIWLSSCETTLTVALCPHSSVIVS